MAKIKNIDSKESLVINQEELAYKNIYKMIPCYLLTEYDFEQLTKRSNNSKEWGKDIFLLGCGFGIKIIIIWAFVIYETYSNSIKGKEILSKIDLWEYYAFIICVILAIILYKIIPKFYVTKEDKLVERIHDFFEREENCDGK